MYWPKVHINEGLRFPLPSLVHQFFLSHLSSPYPHTCEYYMRPIRDMCVESPIRPTPRYRGGPLCVHQKAT